MVQVNLCRQTKTQTRRGGTVLVDREEGIDLNYANRVHMSFEICLPAVKSRLGPATRLSLVAKQASESLTWAGQIDVPLAGCLSEEDDDVEGAPCSSISRLIRRTSFESVFSNEREAPTTATAATTTTTRPSTSDAFVSK